MRKIMEAMETKIHRPFRIITAWIALIFAAISWVFITYSVLVDFSIHPSIKTAFMLLAVAHFVVFIYAIAGLSERFRRLIE